MLKTLFHRQRTTNGRTEMTQTVNRTDSEAPVAAVDDPEQDWGGCSPDQRVEVIGQLEALIRATRRVQLQVIAAHDESGDWRQDGAASMVAWLAFELGLHHRTAAELLATAHRLEEQPALAAAFAEGRLSWDQLRPVLKVATPETDEAWTETATCESAAALQRLARRSRPVSLDEDDDTRRRRSLTMMWNRDGDLLHLRGRLPRELGATVEAALMRSASQAPRLTDGTFAPLDWRLADALTEMASTALGADPDPDRATVLVTTDLETLVTGDGVAEIGGTVTLAGETARRLACDCRLQLVAVDGDGAVVGVGRTTRTIPPWLDRLLRRRDRGCRFPGCSRTRWTNGHHIRYWSQGGPTDLDNLITLCGFHHHLVHEGGWRIEGNPNGEVRFVRPDGRPHQPWFEPLRHEFHARFLDPLLAVAAADTG
jgi:hypothetical protein